MKEIASLLVTIALVCIGLLFQLVSAHGQELRNPVAANKGSLPNKCTAPAPQLVSAKEPLYLPQVPNPIDDTRFFVRQHYRDFLMRDPPDNPGWDFWSNEINVCGSDAGCIDAKRVDVSRAFFFDDNFVALQFPINPGLSSPRGSSTYNQAFVRQCYLTYLRREPNAPPDNNFGGFNFWLGVLNGYGSPTPDAGYNHLIRAFLLSTEYRARFVSPPC
jgi:hypothetical protein